MHRTNNQILNVVLREAICALQLSHREGFEVKVSAGAVKRARMQDAILANSLT